MYQQIDEDCYMSFCNVRRPEIRTKTKYMASSKTDKETLHTGTQTHLSQIQTQAYKITHVHTYTILAHMQYTHIDIHTYNTHIYK